MYSINSLPCSTQFYIRFYSEVNQQSSGVTFTWIYNFTYTWGGKYIWKTKGFLSISLGSYAKKGSKIFTTMVGRNLSDNGNEEDISNAFGTVNKQTIPICSVLLKQSVSDVSDLTYVDRRKV